jgi:hypothetical protein
MRDIKLGTYGVMILCISQSKRRELQIFMPWFGCAQIVPVKVKYFQTVPNETNS